MQEILPKNNVGGKGHHDFSLSRLAAERARAWESFSANPS